MIKGTWIVKGVNTLHSEETIHTGNTQSLITYLREMLEAYPSTVFTVIPTHTYCQECGGEGKHTAETPL